MADEHAGDAEEGQEVFGLALVASVQATAPVRPGHDALNHSAVPAQAAGWLDASLGDARHELPAP
ncbi:hypothetical protein [Streptomyces sp. Go40/10]|uniref:hypothetical protein n=1 Tax=Streptomyces sp. Go40/10 TaxID=2825844 RepID=UPI003FA77E11